MFSSFLPCLLIFTSLALADPLDYAPKSAACPSTPLVRPADSLSTLESSYVSSRNSKASQALKAWLHKTSPDFGTANLPVLGLTISGGGWRSLLTGAGIVQALDGRDSLGNAFAGTGGLLQSLTYQTGQSGGAWLLSSLAGNNYPTISSLVASLWSEAFNTGYSGIIFQELIPVTADIVAKAAAGFTPTFTDPWGQFLTYQLLSGDQRSINLGGITALPAFSSFDMPYPIIQALGVDTIDGLCQPETNATSYELTPYEFGSWDSGVAAFTPTQYLGSALSNGIPTSSSCVVNYDNLGYVLGTSSSLFNDACIAGFLEKSNLTELVDTFSGMIKHTLNPRDEYAAYPNPFFGYAPSPIIASQKELSLVDGGEAGQEDPIWPLLQPARNVDVIFVNDNGGNLNSFPDGSNLEATYKDSIAAGLTKMPVIPPVSTFLSQGLNERPTFFGCNDMSKVTIVYLPNFNYTFPSNEPTLKFQYTPTETTGMVSNGVQIATKGGDAAWPTCLGCAIMKKTNDSLPAACTACFAQYCFN